MVLTACSPIEPQEQVERPEVPSVPPTNVMDITSSAFENNGTIPSKYTCDGENINPPLTFSGVPPHAKSFVLIMDDPDVPKSIRPDGMWDHWVVFNIPPGISNVGEDEQPQGVFGSGTRGSLEYGGPCPPDAVHRYFFKLYALDTMLDLEEGATKQDVEQAMEGHIVASAQLVGRYERQQ